eukprot:TRINITY_DN1032_c0_g6_i1.p1 TRINITY_DN1032_c0_g6~~TRINITY_DN1032_c0_g6_i1.p1  ORF type:complete len:383 (+),score=79.36 TRINITY_DN1032_c0_g6_i1:172-1320(+)
MFKNTRQTRGGRKKKNLLDDLSAMIKTPLGPSTEDDFEEDEEEEKIRPVAPSPMTVRIKTTVEPTPLTKILHELDKPIYSQADMTIDTPTICSKMKFNKNSNSVIANSVSKDETLHPRRLPKTDRVLTPLFISSTSSVSTPSVPSSSFTTSSSLASSSISSLSSPSFSSATSLTNSLSSLISHCTDSTTTTKQSCASGGQKETQISINWDVDELCVDEKPQKACQHVRLVYSQDLKEVLGTVAVDSHTESNNSTTQTKPAKRQPKTQPSTTCPKSNENIRTQSPVILTRAQLKKQASLLTEKGARRQQQKKADEDLREDESDDDEYHEDDNEEASSEKEDEDSTNEETNERMEMPSIVKMKKSGFIPHTIMENKSQVVRLDD